MKTETNKQTREDKILAIRNEREDSLDLEKEYQESYEELLDECNPVATIGTYAYEPSRVLKSVDPIAYRMGLLDYIDSEEQNRAEEIVDGDIS